MDKFKKFIDEQKADYKFSKAGDGQKLGTNNNAARSQDASTAARLAAEKRANSSNQPSVTKKRSVETKPESQPESQPQPQPPQPQKTQSKKQQEKPISEAAAAALQRLESDKQKKAVKKLNNVHGSLATDYDAKKAKPAPQVQSAPVKDAPIKRQVIEAPEQIIETDENDPFFLKTLRLDPVANSIFKMTKSHEERVWRPCFETLIKYLNNITANSEESKYRRIKATNKTFCTKVGPCEGYEHLLTNVLGFDVKIENGPEGEDIFYILPMSADLSLLETAKKFLTTPPRAPVKRDLKLYKCLHNPKEQWNLPANFFIITKDDVATQYEQLKDKKDKEFIMRTQAMREAEKNPKKLYRLTSIRIKFPDNHILQGTFRVNEPLSRVVGFINCCLNATDIDEKVPNTLPYTLSCSHLKEPLNNQVTAPLCDLELIPRAVINLAWTNQPLPFQSSLLSTLSTF